MIPIDGSTEIHGVIGYPIQHTASPAMHNAAFEALGMNARYVAFAVHPDHIADAVRGMRALNIRGLNVTVPHKQAVLPLLDAVSREAAGLGAVNVIENRDGRLMGHNTDGAGFLQSLAAADISAAGAGVALLGAGGAARAVLRALQSAGASAVHLANRTFEKAAALAQEFTTDACPVTAMDFSNPCFAATIKRAKIIVNATSLGMKAGDGTPMDTELIAAHHDVVDIIYNPWETELLRRGAIKGARTLNGYGMLVGQAAAAFKIWTGRDAPFQIMWDAGKHFLEKTAGGR